MSSNDANDGGEAYAYGHAPAKKEDLLDIMLPPNKEGEGDYVLAGWKVENGSLVRKGETVALAQPPNAKPIEAAALASVSASSAKHKRPGRRKRPVAAAAVPAAAVAGSAAATEAPQAHELKSIKLPSSETTGDAKKSVKKPATQQFIPIVAPSTGFVRIRCKASADIVDAGGSTSCIGTIDPCAHPAVVEGLCAVCGEKVSSPSDDAASPADDDGNDPSSNNNTMSRVTVAGGLTVTVSKQEGTQIAKQNSDRLRQLKKLSLILDLDATLVHCTNDPRARRHRDERKDVRSLVLPFAGEHFVKLRPNLKAFFNSIMDQYEIGVYTAGVREYAEQVAIVMSRHIVGAERDQLQLDQLRFQVAKAETQLQTQPKIDDNAGTEEEDNEPQKKKRRVKFSADVEADSKPAARETPRITAEEVQRLKDELLEAEELEKEAMKMRQRIFGSRIVSRTEVGDLGRDVKSLKRIFPCGGTMAAVVDDREDVWANAKDNVNDPNSSSGSRPGEPPENLLLIKPYHWQPFKGFADVNNAAGVDLSNDSDDSADDSDVALTWTADILNRLHARYYQLNEKNETKTVPQILRDMRLEVLKGKKVVLSGVVPMHMHKFNSDSNPQKPRHMVIRFAENLGAILMPAVQAGISFVIADNPGTDKVLMARRTAGCLVVKQSWLWDCFRSISYCDPAPYLLPHLLTAGGREKELVGSQAAALHRKAAPAETVAPAAPVPPANPPAAVVPVTNIFGELTDEDSDEEDDDFAAEFEKGLM